MEERIDDKLLLETASMEMVTLTLAMDPVNTNTKLKSSLSLADLQPPSKKSLNIEASSGVDTIN